MFRVRLPRVRRGRRRAQRRTNAQLTFSFQVEQSARNRVGRMRNQLIREGRLPAVPR